ncbi:biliverdin-producing heme oxygenase (plasmid) [Deinococcus sp. KNUC1210]|uniref:biliverdin-producing heme oxygenase n=1 Tax=Deinococcus sp. KNUC1210 TaxID=2917691 RepID=UPI001EF069CA|nr:biliverdin-producing heme oxygenase [Deinococcus sp. KNUC1210]ULH16970.1 biliverdin-producing heme oxygenase [Deinococcus sp. KNUC1210]
MMMSLLKEATHDQHQAVETLMPVMHSTFTAAGYARLLVQLHAVVEPLEAQLLTLGMPSGFDLHRRTKTPLLRRDLTWFPAAPGASSAPAPLAGVAEGLGALYVLEGATLGGQIISRHLHRTLGLTPERGGAYFFGYGPSTGQRWQEFSQAMNQGVSTEDQSHVIAGAQLTFRMFEQALQALPA